ncbi:MAG: hypothetical protein DWQ07_03045 [Chloroflexi bacterium]|nr:MAG: hypothetical protein DWQ07_03045 [Chloroflexota bacterium]MBL1193523.1 hypothetical protein [Chloroflexota bacterium]NOH10814.1 hypothetical protein [Chloroflexota bacterium]
MQQPTTTQALAIYTSLGDVEGFLVYPYLHNRRGEWIGWVTAQREVYSVHGDYVGWISKEPRLLAKRTRPYDKPKSTPPPMPQRIVPPSSMRLAPMMSELSYDTIDILQDEPERLPTIDAGELRPDMD